ncbi:MAG TPA: ATP-binding cassette domain-containing protein [Ktedonobacterales bacterium]|nr:ATP-binding cassette domain-containing protein [Ktedonobacterales bacterium]
MSGASGAQPEQKAGVDGLRVAINLRRGSFHLRAAFGAPPGLTALLGPSGAGKSLTLQAIAGLTPVASGAITLNGVALVDTKRGIATPARLRRISYVPQSYALFPHLSVAGNIAYGLPPEQGGASWRGWLKSEMRERRAKRIAELLRLVRLPGFEARHPSQLSGGEAQRVALARALAAEPVALLLDEPLSALDAPTREAIRDDLRAIIAASGVPTVLVTHDLAEARALADHLVALCDGYVVAEGSLAEALASPPTSSAARLFAWENILPVAHVERGNGTGWHVTLTSGQKFTLPATPTMDVAQGTRLALAMRAERLEVRAISAESMLPMLPMLPPLPGGISLRGVIQRMTDAGAYYRLRIALDRPQEGITRQAEQEMESGFVTALCSPREWATLGLATGARVAIVAPADAARLVVRDEV